MTIEFSWKSEKIISTHGEYRERRLTVHLFKPKTPETEILPIDTLPTNRNQTYPDQVRTYRPTRHDPTQVIPDQSQPPFVNQVSLDLRSISTILSRALHRGPLTDSTSSVPKGCGMYVLKQGYLCQTYLIRFVPNYLRLNNSCILGP